MGKIFLKIGKPVFFLAFAIFAPFTAFSQNILFNNIDTESFLPHPTVNAIAQDKDGFIWFATQNGLSRYDGRKVKHYYNQPDDPTSLGNNWVSTLLNDSEGRLWVGTLSGAYLYKPETDSFQELFLKDLTNPNVSGIAEDNQGNIWLSTYYSGAVKYEISSGKATRYTLQTLEDITKEINDVFIDKNSTVWLVTSNNGLFFKDSDSEQFVKSQLPLPSQKLRIIYQDKKDNLWVGTEEHSFFSFKGAEIVTYPVADEVCARAINDILEDNFGNFWFASEQGLCQLTPQGQLLTHKESPNNLSSLADNRVFSLSQDKGGVIWVGTSSGVSKWNASLNYFEHLNELNTETLKSNAIMAFTSVENNLYVGSWGEGLSRVQLPEADGPITVFDQRLAQLDTKSIMSLFTDSSKNLWVGTYRSGFYVLPYDSDAFIHVSTDNKNVQLTSNSVSKFQQTSDGTVLVATYGGGLTGFKLDAGVITNSPLHTSLLELPSQYILDLSLDSNGDIWIASSDEGIVKYDVKTQQYFSLFKESEQFNKFDDEEVFNLVMDGEYIWAATGSGLLKISKADIDKGKGSYKLINNQQGLASNFVYGVLKDKYGHIWLSHAKGVSRYTPSTNELQNFNTTHGLQGVDFNSSAIYQTPAGRLLFGGSNGFNSFLPNQLPINNFQPVLRLTGFKQENRTVPIQARLAADGFVELPYDQTVVDFEFAALDYTRPENNRYRYKMLGMSDVWHDLGKNNLVSFSHLPSGDYELNVQGSNNDGLWSDTMRIPIRVLPPIWLTTQAYLLYLSVFFVISAIVFRQMQKQRIKRRAHAKHLHRLAYYDSITGLPNRQNFYESLSNYLDEAREFDAQAWILLFNLDRFKRINDTLGHEFGDKVLVEIANRVFGYLANQPLVEPLRVQKKFDSHFARLGGDEFTLLINTASDKAEITTIIDQLVDLISQPIEIGKYQVTITPSIGVANFPESGNSVSDLLKNADIALHQAKANGRRTHKFYTDVLDNKALERLQIEELMRDAIAKEEFHLVYQPQVNVKQNSVNKAEALIRWNSPVLGFVSPGDFIPIAEESGLIIELGDWILNKACQQAMEWQQAGLDECKVSVNVSSVQFKQSNLLSKIEAALANSGLRPDLLEVELTESAIMSDLEDNIARLNDLKAMGVSIACDDFGTGYSSLSYLKQFPLDTLKIDRSFINDVATDENDCAIVKAIMLLAETMNLSVVAEGVETIDQLQVLNRYNCELIQGFYFSKPLANDEFIKFVQQCFYQDKFMWELELIGKPQKA